MVGSRRSAWASLNRREQRCTRATPTAARTAGRQGGDRVARSLSDLLSILRRIEIAGAGFRSLTEPIDTSTPAGRLMLQLLGAFAEFEQSMIRERSMAGQAAARERGAKIGRPRSMTPRVEAAVVQMIRGGAGLYEAARRYNVHLSSAKRAVLRARVREQ